jgi:hypothetical protein
MNLLSLLGLRRAVPEEGRFHLSILREGVPLARYVDDVWARRDALQGEAKPSASFAWPFKAVAPKKPVHETRQQTQAPIANHIARKLRTVQ